MLLQKERNLEAGMVISYKSVDLPLSIVLWTVRAPLWPEVGFSVISLALFVPQRDYTPATHASSGPLNLLSLPTRVNTTDWLTHTLHITHGQNKVQSCLSKLDQVPLLSESLPWPYPPFSGLTQILLLITAFNYTLNLLVVNISSLHSAFYS